MGFDGPDCEACKSKMGTKEAYLCYCATVHALLIEYYSKNHITPTNWQLSVYSELVRKLNCKPLLARINEKL